MAMIAMIAAGLSSSLSSAGGAAFLYLRRKQVQKGIARPRRPRPSRFFRRPSIFRGRRFRRPRFGRFRRPRFGRFRRPRFGRFRRPRFGRFRRFRPRFGRRRRRRFRRPRFGRAIRQIIRRPKPKPKPKVKKLTYAQQVAKIYGHRRPKTVKRRSPVRRIRRWRDSFRRRRRRRGGGGGGGGGGCFSPQTPIKLQNGDLIHMKDVELGDVLTNGSTVTAVMKIKIQNEPYYKIYSLNLDKHIYVTGTHYVKHRHENDYVQVKHFPEAKITDTFDSVVYCLITDDHKIPIGEHVFWDWEDNLLNI